jgi:HSP20 family molecular chaperone IbpA
MDGLAKSILEGLVAENKTFPGSIAQEQAAENLAQGARERAARLNRKVLRAKYEDGTLKIDLTALANEVSITISAESKDDT